MHRCSRRYWRRSRCPASTAAHHGATATAGNDRRQGVLLGPNRALLRRKRIRTVIPERSDQLAHRKRRGRRGGRAPDLDRETYKRRNVIERAFNKAKHWRAVATRYDKSAITYRAGVVLALIIEWLKSLGDTTLADVGQIVGVGRPVPCSRCNSTPERVAPPDVTSG